MLFMNLKYSLLLILFVAACHKRKEAKQDSQPVESSNESVAVNEAKKVENLNIQKPKISKTLREAIYFAGSLEREALKLILKDSSFQSNTLFTVLSYVVETYSGSKKSTPFGLDCGKFELKFEKDLVRIAKACQRPAVDVAYINTLSENRDYQISFNINHWGRVLGMSAVLTGSDVKCRIGIVEQKLSSFTCENWIFQISEDQLSSTVVKTTDFIFQRKASKQFVIKGGFYKELVQNRKIDIVVPIEGKIKIIEQEIKVIDEFADQKDGVIHEKKKSIEINPVEEKSNQEKNSGESQTSQQGQADQENREEISPAQQSELQGENGQQTSGQEGEPPESPPQPPPTRGRGR